MRLILAFTLCFKISTFQNFILLLFWIYYLKYSSYMHQKPPGGLAQCDVTRFDVHRCHAPYLTAGSNLNKSSVTQLDLLSIWAVRRKSTKRVSLGDYWEPTFNCLLWGILKLVLAGISQVIEVTGNKNTSQIELCGLTSQFQQNGSLLVIFLEIFARNYKSSTIGYTGLLTTESGTTQVMTEVSQDTMRNLALKNKL